LKAAKKTSERTTSEGVIATYIHHTRKLAAMVEVQCETDFVARTDEFQAFANDIAMQVAAINPDYVSLETVPEEILLKMRADFVAELAIEKFHGIGQATATKLHDMGIFTGADLRERSELELIQHFGKMGRFYYRIARGEDDRAVIPNRIRKSISVENSFDPDLGDRVMIETALRQVAIELFDRLTQVQAQGQTLTLKVKFADYTQVTRSTTQRAVITELGLIQTLAQQLIDGLDLGGCSVRLLGLGMSKLDNEVQPFQQLMLPID
jgi:nucleotidyltransferase/DNA polymerase involved in DNA repair